MKTKFLFTAALAAMAFTSCQKDETGQNAPVQPGQDTYIGMTIQLPKSVVSRATDTNATADESTLTSVVVGVWSNGDAAVTYTELNIAADLDGNATSGAYTAKAAIKAKTGSNNIIVLANTTTRPSIAQINGDALNTTITEIAKVNNFVMFSTKVEVMANVVLASEAEIKAAALGSALANSNRTTVNLRRAAAKVAVTSTLDETVAGIADGQNNGILTDIKWNIANHNKKMTVLPKFVAGTDFIASNVNSPFELAALASTIAPDKVLPKTGEPASVEYCLENAHGVDAYKEDNTTAVQVSAAFAPNAQKYVSAITGDVANHTITLGAANMAAGTSFYVSKGDIGATFKGTFFAEAAVVNAKTIFNLTDDDFVEYVDGKCYWAVWINDGEDKPSHGVLRNNMYTMNITKIKAPGFPKFPDTDKPIAADTWIMVDLDVEVWNVKGMGDIEL